MAASEGILLVLAIPVATAEQPNGTTWSERTTVPAPRGNWPESSGLTGRFAIAKLQ